MVVGLGVGVRVRFPATSDKSFFPLHAVSRDNNFAALRLNLKLCGVTVFAFHHSFEAVRLPQTSGFPNLTI